MKMAHTMLAVLMLIVAAVPAALAQQYDLAISNGRVMDPETMYDDIANVGIKGGRIAVITKDTISGKENINATGLVVASSTHTFTPSIHSRPSWRWPTASRPAWTSRLARHRSAVGTPSETNPVGKSTTERRPRWPWRA